MPVLLAEQHVQDWTSAEILAALQRRGYDVHDWHPTQDLEKFVPADWLFFDRTRLKAFGVQYKALYANGTEYWPLNREQHDTLARYPWIVYCASELTKVEDKPNALARARFYGSDFRYQGRLWRRTREPKYLRWPEFIRGFEACVIGHKIESKDELKTLFERARGLGAVREATAATDHLFLNLEMKRAVRVRSGRRAG